MDTRIPFDIDAYITGFPKDIQAILEQLRATVRDTAPACDEAISYGIPAFKLQGKVLIYFAAFKNHIGFYALPSGNDAFKKELASYKTGKGSIQFPLNEPMPLDLIRKIVEFRIVEVTSTRSEKDRSRKQK
jgi:uncharacterized protein YdhG (YjbR/CyaY superfamily)